MSIAIYYKYSYFQKICINIIPNANAKQVAVFIVTDSPLNRYVNIVNIVMPATNETNRAGQNSPSKPATARWVASMNNHVIGIPSSISAHRYVLATGHIIGPLT